MIKLIYKPCEESRKYTAIESTEMIINQDATITETLDAIKSFLIVIGYVIKGDLVIGNSEQPTYSATTEGD